jgi:hypothetical protein
MVDNCDEDGTYMGPPYRHKLMIHESNIWIRHHTNQHHGMLFLMSWMDINQENSSFFCKIIDYVRFPGKFRKKWSTE